VAGLSRLLAQHVLRLVIVKCHWLLELPRPNPHIDLRRLQPLVPEHGAHFPGIAGLLEEPEMTNPGAVGLPVTAYKSDSSTRG
jgi:hypothetical protein